MRQGWSTGRLRTKLLLVVAGVCLLFGIVGRGGGSLAPGGALTTSGTLTSSASVIGGGSAPSTTAAPTTATPASPTPAPSTPTPRPAPVSLNAVDSAGDVGRYTSITIGADGLGLISYQDNSNRDLKVAHCSNLACTTATTATLDSGGYVGAFTSITTGADGLGLISYYDDSNADLKVAHCSNVACSAATLTTLVSAGEGGRGGDPNIVGGYSSITIGADGLGLISYKSNGALDVAHCWDLACSAATTATLDSAGEGGQVLISDTSITIGADGLGLISYTSNGTLKVAHCSNLACSAATVTTLAAIGYFGSITIGADGLGLISYYNAGPHRDDLTEDLTGSLSVLHCSNLACSAATTATLDTAGQVGRYTSITIGADGLGLISYNSNGTLKVAHCSNLACSAATTVTLGSVGSFGAYSSITIGADGLGLISYFDGTEGVPLHPAAGPGQLKVAHCQNAFCVPNHRRR